MFDYELPMLPPNVELETKAVLKQLARSNRALAELKGYADTIPSKHILINAVLNTIVSTKLSFEKRHLARLWKSRMF